MNIPEQIITDAVRVIINTRDFCGNEREAVFEFSAEAGFKGEWKKIHKIANFRANNEWNNWKKAAGVSPRHIF